MVGKSYGIVLVKKLGEEQCGCKSGRRYVEEVCEIYIAKGKDVR